MAVASAARRRIQFDFGLVAFRIFSRRKAHAERATGGRCNGSNRIRAADRIIPIAGGNTGGFGLGR